MTEIFRRSRGPRQRLDRVPTYADPPGDERSDIRIGLSPRGWALGAGFEIIRYIIRYMPSAQIM